MIDITRYDDREIRCPKLGNEVAFAYCRREGGELPCQRVIRCWEDFFPVESFLRDILSPEAWAAFQGQTPPDKLASLLDLAAKARKRRGG
ncbi:MAG: hypothetical protein QM278_08460 [Pseudomonadota bacterium]|nr:hypothetical protein [Pseudomonadota bacterium]